MHCFRANTWYRSENPRIVCVFLSPVLIPSSTNSRVDHFRSTRYLWHLPVWNFYCMPPRSKIIRKASLAHHKYLLLAEFSVRTVNYGPSFFSTDLWPKRVGIYAVEQFSLLFSKDKLKQHTPNPWSATSVITNPGHLSTVITWNGTISKFWGCFASCCGWVLFPGFHLPSSTWSIVSSTPFLLEKTLPILSYIRIFFGLFSHWLYSKI